MNTNIKLFAHPLPGKSTRVPLLRLMVSLALVLTLLCLSVPALAASWTCPNCSSSGLSGNFCPNCGTKRPTSSTCSACGYNLGTGNGYSYCPNCGNRLSGSSGTSNSTTPYDIGIPNIGSTVIRANQMNLTVLWVQQQLKATGVYYQGDIWDVTGMLGAHTQQEIASFMSSRGYSGHNGTINQTVIDELASYLGSRVVPVYAGGFYDAMNSIMTGGSAGSMADIVSNLRDMIPHTTIGARWVQCCLSKLGYYTSSIDGKYGEGTENAVKAFQRTHGFQEVDHVSLGVARAMLEEYYAQGYSLADLP